MLQIPDDILIEQCLKQALLRPPVMVSCVEFHPNEFHKPGGIFENCVCKMSGILEVKQQVNLIPCQICDPGERRE